MGPQKLESHTKRVRVERSVILYTRHNTALAVTKHMVE